MESFGDADLATVELLSEDLQSTLKASFVGLLFFSVIVRHVCCGV